MPMLDAPAWICSCLLLSMRIAPIFAFAPPFTLVRAPVLFRLLFGMALATSIISANPEKIMADISPAALIPAAVSELLLGMIFVLLMQLCFASLQLAGRLIDIQAGFGLATLIDPTSHAQTPLVGTLFAYAAGALFFSMDGHFELLRIIVASLEAAPIGGWAMPVSLARLTAYIATIFILGMGVAGAAILILLLVDMIIALLARTVPQMNVLIMGFQVKTIALLLVLPLCLGMGGALMAQMIRITLETLPKLI